MLQREFYSRVESDTTPEVRALQERFKTLEMKELDIKEQIEEASTEDVGILSAIEESNKKIEEEKLRFAELERKRDFQRSEAEALKPEVEGLAERVKTSIESYKGSEDFEEDKARSYLKGFWYGTEMARKAHP